MNAFRLWLRSVIFKAFHRFFSLILISEVWQCLSRILTFHIRGPSSFCLEKKLNFFSVIWNLLLCKTLLLQSKISGTPNLIQYLPVFAAILFCLHPYKTFSPCSRNWQPQREAVSTVLSCRRSKSCAFYMQPCLLQLMTLC